MSHTAPPAQYGSDLAGLIAGYAFSEGRPGEPLDSEQAALWLRQPVHGEFIWLHFNLANVAAERWMRTHLALPEAFYEAHRGGSRSTRIEQTDGQLLAVINDVAFSFDLTSSDIATLWVHVDERVLVTTRIKPLHSADQLRAAVKYGEAFDSTINLLVHLLQDQAEVLTRVVRQTSVKVDAVEDHLLAHRLQDHRAELANLRRVLVRFQRLLAPEPAALFRLLNKPPRWVRESDLQDLRESTEEFALVLNDLAGLVERIKLLQEELAAKLNEQTNRTLFTLTIVTVLALPINIVAGFFGMNVGGVPLSNHPHGFWILVLLVASFTGLAGWWAFRRQQG